MYGDKFAAASFHFVSTDLAEFIALAILMAEWLKLNQISEV